MKRRIRTIFGAVLLSGLVYGPAAMACSTDGWLGGVAQIPPNGLADSPPVVSRYSGFCALEVTDTSHVQSNAASDARYRGRFYVLDGLSGSGDVEIFEAYADESANTPLFKIVFDGSQFTFDASSAVGGGTSAPVAAADGWNLVEFDWQADGSFSYWVNSDANVDPAAGSVNAGTGVVESVRLGAPNGLGGQSGKLTFDAFESHRATPVGPLLAADANNDETVNILDLGVVRIELLNPGSDELLAPGQPDCNSDGSINILDVGCVRLILLN